ncbi:MAG: TetR/AcrR family transcriptional regulator [bacterium]
MDRERRRREILGSARKIFAQKGYHKTTVDDIVQDAGIAKGTFYLYFKDKKDIFASLIDEIIQMIYEAIEDIDRTEPSSKEEIVSQFKMSIERALNIYRENLTLAKIFLREAIGVDPEFEEKLHNCYAVFAEHIQRSLKRGIGSGLFREMNVEVASHCIIGAVYQVAYQWLIVNESEDLEDVIDEIVRIYLHGIFA